jgi:hypothetical protein
MRDNALNKVWVGVRASRIGRWTARSDGTAAMEFALLVPFMVYMFLCATDIARALTVARRLTNAADTIAQLVSQSSNSSSSCLSTNGAVGNVKGSVADCDVDTAFRSIITTFPDVLNDANGRGTSWFNIIQPIVSSVTFGPASTCTSSSPLTAVCTTATVNWSAGYNTSNLPPFYRTCTTLTSVPDTNPPSLTTLPATFFTTGGAPGYSGSLIVADVIYQYQPLFTSWIVGKITFQRTAYLSPRFFTQLTYSGKAGSVDSSISGCP